MSSNDPEAMRRIRNRLRRANGQLSAVITAVESGARCRDVVTQLAAVSSALDRAGFAIIATTMKECLADPEGVATEDGMTPDDLEKLFLMLARHCEPAHPKPSSHQGATMCRAVPCRRCGKTTWSGCGQHVTEVMRGVAKTDRCMGHENEPSTGFFARIFGR